jgi:protocatechuate 3,4-dioxygenase beta subunit
MGNLGIYIFCILALTLRLACCAEAKAVFSEAGTDCRATASAENDYEPLVFLRSNNLLKRPGQGPLFCGERVMIYGRVVDESCKPIKNAAVYLWQVGCDGKYPYVPLKTKVNAELINSDAQTSFTGNGMIRTNNEGEFFFWSVYPAPVQQMAPHVNLRISHEGFALLQAQIILGESKISPSEMDDDKMPILSRYRDFLQQEAVGVYGGTLVLPAIHD